MKIEVLFPEFCNLYGDMSNIEYLHKCIPEAEIIYTSIDEEPAFLTQNVNLIYLGPLTERKQEIVINKLKPIDKNFKSESTPKEVVEEVIEEFVKTPPKPIDEVTEVSDEGVVAEIEVINDTLKELGENYKNIIIVINPTSSNLRIELDSYYSGLVLYAGMIENSSLVVKTVFMNPYEVNIFAKLED